MVVLLGGFWLLLRSEVLPVRGPGRDLALAGGRLPPSVRLSAVLLCHVLQRTRTPLLPLLSPPLLALQPTLVSYPCCGLTV